MKTVLVEALLILASGAVLAFAANALSPRGLNLRRDYFPAARVTNSVQTAPIPAGENTNDSFPALAQLRAQGISLADNNRVQALFKDPRYADGLVAFIDARNDEEYQAGHIPGAYQFDRFHPELYMGTVLPVCNLAQQVVVYCNGGACEDSSFAAQFLVSAGVPKEKLSVYVGGMSEWSTNGLPIELGQRASGQLQRAAK